MEWLKPSSAHVWTYDRERGSYVVQLCAAAGACSLCDKTRSLSPGAPLEHLEIWERGIES